MTQPNANSLHSIYIPLSYIVYVQWMNELSPELLLEENN